MLSENKKQGWSIWSIHKDFLLQKLSLHETAKQI